MVSSLGNRGHLGAPASRQEGPRGGDAVLGGSGWKTQVSRESGAPPSAVEPRALPKEAVLILKTEDELGKHRIMYRKQKEGGKVSGTGRPSCYCFKTSKREPASPSLDLTLTFLL